LELGARLKALNGRQPADVRFRYHQKPKALVCEAVLDSQTLAAFGAACIDHSAAAASLHADQEAVGTCATDFGRLVCAFHEIFLTGSVVSAWPASATHQGLDNADFGLIAPNTIRGTADYRKFSQAGQHLRRQSDSFARTAAVPVDNVDKVLIN
jgi:hypothetical protein